MIDQMISHIKQNSPTGLLTRAQIETLTNGLLKRKRLTDLDCKGGGIPGKMYAGHKVVYEVDAVCEFLRTFVKRG